MQRNCTGEVVQGEIQLRPMVRYEKQTIGQAPKSVKLKLTFELHLCYYTQVCLNLR